MPMDEDRLVPEDGGPESVAIAQTYLMVGSIEQAADDLGMSVDLVAQELNKPEVRAYMAQVFSETGFRNRDKMFGLLDHIINEKLKEAEETGVLAEGTLMEVLETVHNMKMKELQLEIKMIEAQAKLKNGRPNTQVNIQSNNYGGSDGFNTLMGKLMGGKN